MSKNESSSIQVESKVTNKTTNNETRRRFLKKAAIGAPIVIASSAKPAWGAACMSGIMSGNLSNHEHVCTLSGGLSHGHWKTHWVGNSKYHHVDEDMSKPLKDKYKPLADRYFVKIGQDKYYSDFNRFSSYKIGGITFQNAMEIGNRFQREIVTAFISASLAGTVNYPYSLVDVYDILDEVEAKSGDYEFEESVCSLLEGIHQGATSI